MAGERTSRRGFVKGIVPVCWATCAGLECVSALAKTAAGTAPAPPRHKFDEPTPRPLTYRQRFELEYGQHLIPYLKVLDGLIGRPKVLESLEKLALQEAKDYADQVRAREKADLSVFKRHFSPTTPGMKELITVEVLEDSESVYEIRITECLWAAVFRGADAAAYGFAAVCSGDAPFARFVNPHLDMDLRGTLMEVSRPASCATTPRNDAWSAAGGGARRRPVQRRRRRPGWTRDAVCVPSTEERSTKTPAEFRSEGAMSWQGSRRVSVDAVGALVLAAVAGAAGAPRPEVTVMLPGDVPLVLVRIPAGTFTMGSPPSERSREDDETAHQVTLSHDYYIGKYEVTQAQWQAVTGSNPSYFSSGGDFPVDRVSWDDITGADGFLAGLNRHLAATGQPGAGRMRLPTEAEWERAARAGTTTRFSYGDVLDCRDVCRPCATHSRAMWWCGDGPGKVGVKQPNPYGLHDAHGNVAEWVQDWYGPYGSSAQTDPRGPARGSDRVTRGGGSNSPLQYSRSAARGLRSPGDHHEHTGLRVAATF